MTTTLPGISVSKVRSTTGSGGLKTGQDGGGAGTPTNCDEDDLPSLPLFAAGFFSLLLAIGRDDGLGARGQQQQQK